MCFQNFKSWINSSEAFKLNSHVPIFDVMNVFACLAVVILHANESFWNFTYDKRWIFSNIIENLFYWAVPVFFMISGATIIDYRQRYSTKMFFKKRFQKTFIPFIVWSLIDICLTTMLKLNTIDISGQYTIKELLNIVFNTSNTYIYWFFIALFAIYLSIPIISLIPQEQRKKSYLYMIAFSVLTLSILPLLCTLTGIQMNPLIETPISAGYLIYTLLGYCITKYPISKKCRISLYILGLSGFLVQLIGTHFLSYKSGTIDQTFKGYLNLPCVLFSVAVFVWFYYNKSLVSNKKFIKIISFLSGASFGVYLVHIHIQRILPTFIYIFFKVNIDSFGTQWALYFIPFIYFASLIIVLIIKKIPILKRIVP